MRMASFYHETLSRETGSVPTYLGRGEIGLWEGASCPPTAPKTPSRTIGMRQIRDGSDYQDETSQLVRGLKGGEGKNLQSEIKEDQ
jgi:hypothetical protein